MDWYRTRNTPLAVSAAILLRPVRRPTRGHRVKDVRGLSGRLKFSEEALVFQRIILMIRTTRGILPSMAVAARKAVVDLPVIVCLVAVGGVSVLPVRADKPDAIEPARMDCYGDRLPP